MPRCCFCWRNEDDDSYYQDAKTRPSVDTNKISKGDRGFETDSRASDRRAVKVWRQSRSSSHDNDSPTSVNSNEQQHVQLSPQELKTWQDRAAASSSSPKRGTSNMATLDSIEVDELSTVRGTRPLDPSSPPRNESSSPRNKNSPSSLRNAQKSSGPVDVDELDAIVLALSSKDSSNSEGQNNTASPSSSRRKSPPPSSYSQRLSPSSRDVHTTSRRTSPSPNRRSSRDQGRRSSRSPTYSDRHGRDDRPQAFPVSDSLSNVPSNVDAATRDRYLMACRILKATLIERDTTLLPQEKSFLQGLLDDSAKSPSEVNVSAMETASATLLSDPLFHVDSVHSSSFPTDGVSAKALDSIKAAWHQKAEAKRRANKLQMMPVVGKNNNSPRNMAASPMNTSRLSDDTPQIKNLAYQHQQQQPPSSPSRSLLDTDDTSSFAATAISSSLRDRNDDYPFHILGIDSVRPGVLTPPLLEALRGFFPYDVAEENFWLKYSLQRDGAKLSNLLSKVRTSVHTIIGVETQDGHVFGAFCSTPWRVQSSWFGNGDTFLWRLKNSRLQKGKQQQQRNFDDDNEMEIFPFTGSDDRIQYCTRQTMAVGGGDWMEQSCPYPGEPKGIGFMVDGDLMGGETNSCATFANPRLCGRSSHSNEFDIVNLEIWTVTPCHTEADAELQEMRQLFVMEESKKRRK